MANPRQIVRDFSIMGSTLKPLGNVNASSQIKQLRNQQSLTLRREPTNPADKNAILVMYGQYALGYLPRGLASSIAPMMDNGVKVICRKAPNALYGVCQIAYIPPEPKAAEPTEQQIEEAVCGPADVDQTPEAQLLTVEEAEASFR
jgi:HIRAN domain